MERRHRTIKSSLIAVLNNKKTKKWIDILSLVILSINNQPINDTYITPSQLMYGMELNLPVDFFVKNEKNLEVIPMVLG